MSLSLFALLVLVLAILSGCGSEDNRIDAYVQTPPAQFRHPFPGVRVTKTDTLEQMQIDCAGSIDVKPGDYIWACSRHLPHTSLVCEMWMPSLTEVTERMLAALQTYELANCEGWHDDQFSHH